ncbi:hypothetical protein CLV28_2985 [Sediminihabitans luteus]|uniref:Uncharacterized protein n=1 Tax=Sediminihabitans luteus TaxID=1138585 RepID=A0A2M9CBW3_9CELL|nr:hypothetical protein CLV28_2985 [Sediminihabitans luteus]GII99905.1 hypothetical protein Slu03_22830 [Sediminihabitans luteus]
MEGGDRLEVSDSHVRQTWWLGLFYLVILVGVIVVVIVANAQQDAYERFEAAWWPSPSEGPGVSREVVVGLPTVEGAGVVRTSTGGRLEAAAYAVVGSQEHGPETKVEDSADGDLVVEVRVHGCTPVAGTLEQLEETVRVTVVGEATREWTSQQYDYEWMGLKVRATCDGESEWTDVGPGRRVLVHVPLAEPLGDRAARRRCHGRPGAARPAVTGRVAPPRRVNRAAVVCPRRWLSALSVHAECGLSNCLGQFTGRLCGGRSNARRRSSAQVETEEQSALPGPHKG